MKYISILGSTGSIGTQTLEIVEELPDKFKAVALTAGKNIDLLTEQVKQYSPEFIAIENENYLEELKNNISNLNLLNPPIISAGKEGLRLAASWDRADTVVTGIVG